MAVFGKIRVHKYKPRQRPFFITLEETVLNQLKLACSQHNSWQKSIEEITPGLRTIKSKISDNDIELFEYHVEKAGKRFLNWVAENDESVLPVIEILNKNRGLFFDHNAGKDGKK